MSESLLYNFLMPLTVGVATPILLFGIAYCLMQVKVIQRLIAKTYSTVISGLQYEISLKEPEDLYIETIDNDSRKVLEKTSKNYGSEGHWKSRTFYTFTKAQVLENDFINFKIRGLEDELKIPTAWFIKTFDLNSEKEHISDGAGKIRAYLNQEKSGSNDFYLIRFGKKTLEKPIKLDASVFSYTNK